MYQLLKVNSNNKMYMLPAYLGVLDLDYNNIIN